MEAPNSITLRGVRVHNLRSIDVAIPLGRLTVVTGVSGAGKSSLVFDTLYAEAQRRYLQSFSTYTRQFLERFDRPDADEIGDLPPAIAIRGSTQARSTRATVGSLTEIADDLRLVSARAGTLVCPGCGQVVTAHRPQDVLAALQALPLGTRCTIAFPAAPSDLADQLVSLREEGYLRVQIGGTVHRLDEQALPKLAEGDTVWVLLDRVEIGKTPIERLAEAIELAFRRGQGQLGVLADTETRVFDQRYYCPRCRRVYAAPEPRRFDLHDPWGACPACEGAGTIAKTGEVCPTCQGRRWNAEALAVQLGGKNIADWSEMPLRELLAFMQTLPLPANQREHAEVLLAQIRDHLQALVTLGLQALRLLEPAAALTDGESRRIALAGALTSNLVQVLYLIDEPSTGLLPHDFDRLPASLLQLRDRGNTVVVIEHDRRIIAVADHLIDLGPGAGEEGGQITYQGPPSRLCAAAENFTSDYYCGRCVIEAPARKRQPTGFVTVDTGLRNLEVPVGVLSVATGAPLRMRGPLRVAASRSAPRPAEVVLLDQAPLPRSARSNPATYLKIFDEIRNLFAENIDARIRNFGPGTFSFNQPGGRCETCAGEGTITIDMRFLADVVSVCPECQGRRYRKEVLDIKVRSLSIAEVLDLTIREAFRFFRAQPKIEKKLKWLLDVGLDYLRLGQSVETFSGGECQRLKLAGHLASHRKGSVLFVLVEPTAGLHPADVANLLACFDRLLAAGHSLLAVDTDPDLLNCADVVLRPHSRSECST